jgi:hypothetical protein
LINDVSQGFSRHEICKLIDLISSEFNLVVHGYAYGVLDGVTGLAFFLDRCIDGSTKLSI